LPNEISPKHYGTFVKMSAEKWKTFKTVMNASMRFTDLNSIILNIDRLDRSEEVFVTMTIEILFIRKNAKSEIDGKNGKEEFMVSTENGFKNV
jgi:hypothetical protein